MKGKKSLKEKTNQINQKIVATLVVAFMLISNCLPILQLSTYASNKETYEVKYFVGNNLKETRTVEEGTTIRLNYLPYEDALEKMKDGYYFIGWSPILSTLNPYYQIRDFYTPEGTTSFYAKWEKIPDGGFINWGQSNYKYNCWINDDEWNNITETKTIRWSVNAYGQDVLPYIQPSPEDCYISIKGPGIDWRDHVSETGEGNWTITENGYYEATIETPAGSTNYWFNIPNIGSKPENYVMHFNGSSSCSDEKNYSKEKIINLEANVSGLIGPNEQPNPEDCIMTVNGKAVENKNGKGQYTVTENGKYEVYIKYKTYGEDGAYKKTYNITTIDKKAPEFDSGKIEYPTKNAQESATGDKYSVKVRNSDGTIKQVSLGDGAKYTVIAKDPDGRLKSIKLGDSTKTVTGEKGTASFDIKEPGSYTCIIEDEAGNKCEKTVDISMIDKKTPEVKSYKIEKNGQEVSSIEDCINVTSGDKLKITLTCDEKIQTVGAVERGSQAGSPHGILQIGKVNVTGVVISGYTGAFSEIGSETIEFNVDVNSDFIEELDPGEEYYFRVNGISDYSNNYIEQYKIPMKIVLDDTKPVINSFEITGGIKDGTVMQVQKGDTVKFDVTVNEKLAYGPTIKISNKEYSTKFDRETEKENVKNYVYSATVTLDELGENVGTGIPVTVTKVVDIAGNEAEEKTYNDNNLTTNNVYLYNGIFETEKLYIVPTEKEGKLEIKGDYNKDGYLTLYDLTKMKQYINNLSKFSGDQISNIIKIGDLNGDNKLTDVDYELLSKEVTSAKNNMYQQEKTFKVLTKNSSDISDNLKGDNLSWKIYDKNNNEITGNAHYITSVNYSADDGTFTVKVNTSFFDEITIKVESTNGEYGTLKLYSGKKANAGIRVEKAGTDVKGNFYMKGDINRDGFVTTYDALAALLISAGVEMPEGFSQSSTDFSIGDVNDDGEVNSADALELLRAGLNISCERFNAIQKGDLINLYMASIDENSSLDENISDIQWDIIPLEGDVNAFKKVQNTADNKTTISADGDVNSSAVIRGTGKNSEGEDVTALIFLRIEDLNLSLDTKEIKYDLSEYEEADNEGKEALISKNTITPTINIGNKQITASSNNTAVARVETDESTGKYRVIPVGVGSTHIVFTCNGKTVSCNVVVNRKTKNITINNDKIKDSVLNLEVGDQEQFTVTTDSGEVPTITPENYKNVFGVRKNESTYTINAIGIGSGKIIVSCENIKEEITVNVSNKSKEITGIKTDLGTDTLNLEVGDVKTVNVYTDDNEKVTGLQASLSGSPDIATVRCNDEGVCTINALGKGQGIILTLTAQGKSETITININEKKVENERNEITDIKTNLNTNVIDLNVGDIRYFNVILNNGEGATEDPYIEVVNSEIISVEKSGNSGEYKICANNIGTARIRISSPSHSTIYELITVNVKEANENNNKVPITSIETNIEGDILNLTEGEEKELVITTNQGATEVPRLLYNQTGVYILDYKNGKHIIRAQEKGSDTIKIYSPSDPSVYKIITVNVREANENPNNDKVPITRIETNIEGNTVNLTEGEDKELVITTNQDATEFPKVTLEGSMGVFSLIVNGSYSYTISAIGEGEGRIKISSPSDPNTFTYINVKVQKKNENENNEVKISDIRFIDPKTNKEITEIVLKKEEKRQVKITTNADATEKLQVALSGGPSICTFSQTDEANGIYTVHAGKETAEVKLTASGATTSKSISVKIKEDSESENGNGNGSENGNGNGSENGNGNGSENGNGNGSENGSENGNGNGSKNENGNGNSNGAGTGSGNGASVSQTGKIDSYSGSLPYTGAQTAGIMIAGIVIFDLGIVLYFFNKKKYM